MAGYAGKTCGKSILSVGKDFGNPLSVLEKAVPITFKVDTLHYKMTLDQWVSKAFEAFQKSKELTGRHGEATCLLGVWPMRTGTVKKNKTSF